MQGAVAGRHHLRRYQRQQADDEAADHGAQRRPQAQTHEELFAQRHTAQQRNSEHGGEEADGGGNNEIVGRHDHLVGRDNADLDRRKRVRDEVADHRRDCDRRQAVGRIAADDELEAVESAGERRTEGAGNSSGSAATDQDTQIGAPQPECRADARGKTARQLGIAGLEADRGADPARPDGLRRDDDAAEKRHAAAMQRIRLDRIDLPLRPPARDHFRGDAERQSAAERHRDRQHRIEAQQPRQAHACIELEQ